LGLPPGDLADMLAGSSGIPVPPPQLAVGIPQDLLRRRPDVRAAEYRAMAQGAQIGVARADLFPAFSLSGTFGLLSTNLGRSTLGDMFQWQSRNYVWGPGVQWNIFNYGQITNNVRLQDARFQELLVTYQNTVLTAQQNVEDAIVAFVRSQERAEFLARSTEAAKGSLGLAVDQYKGGVADFTTVILAEQSLLSEQDNFVSTLGSIASNLVAIYRALGGGWQIREGTELVPPEVKEVMAKRTNWGNLLNQATYMPPAPGEKRPAIPLPDW
jgi:outer membrane protein TolC